MASDFSKWLDIAREPFFLIDFEGSSHLYRGGELLVARHLDDVLPALERLRGADAVGFLSYEAGFAFEQKLADGRLPDDMPLLWFMTGSSSEEPPPLPDPRSAWARAPHPMIDREHYVRSVQTIREHILDGDIYQANLTFQSEVRTLGHPLALYAQLRQRAEARWSAVVFTGTHWLLSLSPELFFTCAEGKVTCRPMKGTAAANSDPEILRNDPKQRSENLMIIDLLRNDLSRVARPGSVEVPEMFAVETYPTVLQMTSTVTGELLDGLRPVDLLKAVFPCGSITGAPKIRAMEIIGDLECSPRGIYTGSIGTLSSDGSGAFNVAIRTLVMRNGESVARIGLGSGIVADSDPDDEWEECLRKGAFVGSPSDFRLIETMRIDAAGTLPDMEAHLARLQQSSDILGFRFGETLRDELTAQAKGQAPGRLRLELARDGTVRIESSPLPHSPDLAEVGIAARTTNRDDFRLRHKTSDRDFYDGPRIESGFFEILFTDDEGFLTEGSFTNLFVERDGRLVTPPLERGLLPGILRQKLIASGKAVEGDLRPDDLGETFYIGNALRGLIPAQLSGPARRS